VTLALIAISLVVFAVLAMRESPLWHWGVAVLVIGLLSGLDFPGTGISYGLGGGSWVLLAIGAIMLLLSVEAIRKPLLITPIYGGVKSILPRVSRT
jgi:acyl-CoA dehydrogenase